MFGKPIVIDLQQIKSGIIIAGKPLFEAQDAPAPQLRPTPVRQYEERKAVIEPQPLQELTREERPQLQPTPRQTSFNDQNYQPKGAVNSIPAPKPALYSSNTQPQRVQHKPVLQTGYWTWTGADKKKTRHKIQWQTVNGWIEYHTVCQNERRGSIEYRDCRKAAKEYFVHRCRTEKRKAFCAAENNYNPL
mgnify:CR=1 FL=1